MPPVEVPIYPPCSTRVLGRVKGFVTNAFCLDANKQRYQQLVRPIDCRRCLGLEPAALLNSDVQPEVQLPAELRPSGSSSSSTLPVPLDAHDTPEPPGLIRRAISYTEALARWTAAGRPERSDKEVERIFHQHCKSCSWFDAERQICRGCGCRVAESGVAILNKIKMATENCPRDFW